MRAAGVFLALCSGVLVPFLLPHGWTWSGLLPDAALLATLYLSFRGTAERAAWFGIAAGLLCAPWTDEPLLLRPVALGSIGWLAGGAASVLHRDSVGAVAAVAALSALVLRVVSECAAGALSGAFADGLRQTPAALGCALLTALLAPVAFAAVRASGLLAPLERSFRDV